MRPIADHPGYRPPFPWWTESQRIMWREHDTEVVVGEAHLRQDRCPACFPIQEARAKARLLDGLRRVSDA